MPYTPRKTVRRARSLRRHQTEAEKRLWGYLRDRRLNGFKFVRQEPVGPYIADFFCAELGLIVEADGDSHSGPHDLIRDRWLQDKGFLTLRLSNRDINGNLSGCMDRIAGELGR